MKTQAKRLYGKIPTLVTVEHGYDQYSNKHGEFRIWHNGSISTEHFEFPTDPSCPGTLDWMLSHSRKDNRKNYEVWNGRDSYQKFEDGITFERWGIDELFKLMADEVHFKAGIKENDLVYQKIEDVATPSGLYLIPKRILKYTLSRTIENEIQRRIELNPEVVEQHLIHNYYAKNN